MKYPTPRFIFNRRKTASKKSTASVEIEIAYDWKQKRIATPVKLYINEWDKKRMCVVNRIDSEDLNNILAMQMEDVKNAIKGIVDDGEDFSFDILDMRLAKPKRETFLAFARRRISERVELADGTRKHHKSWLNILEQYGKIVYFSDLKYENIVYYDEWLHSRGIGKRTIMSHHKTMKVYVHEAMAYDLIDKDPYAHMHYERMTPSEETIRYLEEEDVNKLRSMELDGYLARVRDLFIVQCFTGMAYADLAKFDFKDAMQKDGNTVVKDARQKTGETYYIVLLKPVLEILDRYNGVLPMISNQKYNAYLKILQEHAGIQTKLTTHVGRHTFATMMLNKRVPIEIVAKMMGHSTSRTTEIYAKILGTSVQQAFMDIAATIE